MSAPGLASPLRPRLRPWLVVLLPFVALGVLPWWACLALSLSLVLGRLNDDSRSVSALLTLLAAVVVSLPLLLGPDPERLQHSGLLFGQAAAAGLLALASMRALENGQRRGLVLPAAALLLFPQPAGLAALLLSGLGMDGAESRPQLRLGTPSRRIGWALLGAVLLPAALALLLGHVLPAAPSPPAATVPPPASTRPAPEASRPPSPPSQAAGTRTSSPASTAAGLSDDQALLLRPLLPLTGILVVICLLLLLQQTRLKRAERRSTWADVAAILALLGTLFMLGVLGAGSRPGGLLGGSPPAQAGLSGGRSAAAAEEATRHAPAWLALLLNIGIVSATVFFAFVAVYLYLALRSGRQVQPAQPLAEGADPFSPALPPLHRVRLAWRSLEAALAQAGLARLISETPEDFSRRLAGTLPAAADDLQTLTRLYLPVRYGGELSEHDAERAEAAAEHVRRALSTAPPLT